MAIQKFKSYYPLVSVQGGMSGRWYIIANGIWHEVGRSYGWNELEKMWIPLKTKPKYPKSEPSREWTVEGSKGKTYVVKSDDGFWTCSCPAHAFGRGKDCKHITTIKANNKKRN